MIMHVTELSSSKQVTIWITHKHWINKSQCRKCSRWGRPLSLYASSEDNSDNTCRMTMMAKENVVLSNHTIGFCSQNIMATIKNRCAWYSIIIFFHLTE